MNVGEAVPRVLADAAVLDEHGQSSELRQRWSARPVVLVFLRHFGCVGCSVHVDDLAPRLPEIRDLGVGVTFVGNGAPHFIAGFRERYALDPRSVEIVTDPTLATFDAAGLLRSRVATLGPRALYEQLRAWGNGHRNGRLAGDAWQQGGTLLVDDDGVLRFYWRDRSLGGFAPAVELLDTILALRAQAAALPA